MSTSVAQTGESSHLSSITTALCDIRLSPKDYDFLKEFIEKEKDRAVIDRLVDNKIYITKTEYGVKLDIPVTFRSYAKSSFEMMSAAKWVINEDDYFLPTYLGKLGIPVQSDVPEEGCLCKHELEDPDNWSFGDWDDPAMADSNLPGYRIVTKAHVQAVKDKRFSTGVYYSPSHESIYFVLERDNTATFYHGDIPDDSNRKKLHEEQNLVISKLESVLFVLGKNNVATFYYGDMPNDSQDCKKTPNDEQKLVIGEIVFNTKREFKKLEADAKYLKDYVKLMDCDPSILPPSLGC